MKKKKLVALGMVAAMAATAVVGGTLAYFTDTDSKTNVFTAGNVDIEQWENDRNGNKFEDNQKLYPIVNDSITDYGYHSGKNYIDKFVTVENTGTEEAYVRTYIGIPTVLDDGANTFNANNNVLQWTAASANYSKSIAQTVCTYPNATKMVKNEWYWDKDLTNDWPEGTTDWNFFQVTVDDIDYNVYVATHKTVLKAGAITAPNLYGVFLDESVDTKKDDKGKIVENTYTYKDASGATKEFTFDLSNVKILVATEAAQAEGFTDKNNNGSAADEALDAAFGKAGTYCPFEGGSLKN